MFWQLLRLFEHARLINVDIGSMSPPLEHEDQLDYYIPSNYGISNVVTLVFLRALQKNADDVAELCPSVWQVGGVALPCCGVRGGEFRQHLLPRQEEACGIPPRADPVPEHVSALLEQMLPSKDTLALNAFL